MGDFTKIMRNKLSFFDCLNGAPAIPGGNETLKVERNGDQLTIMESKTVFRDGLRIHAVLKSSSGDVSTFEILSRLPSGKTDAAFFAAEGTAEVTEPSGGKITLYVKGTDSLGASCRGWIFDATEVELDSAM